MKSKQLPQPPRDTDVGSPPTPKPVKQLKTRVVKLSPLNNQNVSILQDLRSMVNTLNRHKRLSLMAQVIDLETAAIAADGEFNKKAIAHLYTLSQKIDHNRVHQP